MLTRTELDLGPPRALAAIHVASAVRAAGVVADFVAHDERQLDAAAALGLPVTSPR